MKLKLYTALVIGLSVSGGASSETTYDDSAGAALLSLDPETAQQAEDTYWTLERMENAQPAPMPNPVVHENQFDVEAELDPIMEPPVLVPGWSLESGEPPPPPDAYYELNIDESDEFPYFDTLPQAYGTPPMTNPKIGPYGPFQRWSMQGKYPRWPRGIHGKLFFSDNSGGNFVCSATVINRSTLATAGHCVSNGAGTWHKNWLFCPSYSQTGAHPEVGCWNAVAVRAPAQFHTGGDADYDYACLVTSNFGTVKNQKIGITTGGWAGRAYNFSVKQPVMQFGYPAAPPFDGKVIQQVASTEWYEVDTTSGGQKSKYIGSDLTPGSSGGGWFLSWRHPSTEYPDTDGSNITDPAGAMNGPYITGVNSHKRCINGCFEPPTVSAGTFWQEMGSPPFRSTSATGEVKDINDVCFAHSNNDP